MPKHQITPEDEPMVECAYCGLPVVDDGEFCGQQCRALYDHEMEWIRREQDEIFREVKDEREKV